MSSSSDNISVKIKEYALQLGFDACGFCKAEKAEDEEKHFNQWLQNGYNADMEYLAKNSEKRYNPQLLVDQAQSIICVALNYYPTKKQNENNPQFAYYAYGKDYHKVVKNKLEELYKYIQSLVADVTGRVFCDTAPLLERYWAAKAGLGFIGKNSLLIIPRKGSFFFLGEIILNIKLDYDKPLNISCGSCSKCIESCPTQAIEKPYVLNSNNCISYQTIENRHEIKPEIINRLNNNFYGCDICQKACPWNKFAQPNKTVQFEIKEELLNITFDELKNLTVEKYQELFKDSAIKRAKYEGLMRNIKALEYSKKMK